MAVAVRKAQAPGFFATDVAEALKQRAAWLDSLDDSCFLTGNGCGGDPDSGGSSEEEEEEEQPQPTTPANKAEVDPKNNPIDETPLCFAESQKRFAGARFDDWDDDSEDEDWDDEAVGPLPTEKGGGRATTADSSSRASILSRPSSRASTARFSIRRLEPPARRLQRVRGEVETFCLWVESRKNGKHDGNAMEEVERLGIEVTKVAELVQRASAEQKEMLPPEVFSKRIWMPPQASDDVAMAQHLVELARLSSNSQASNAESTGDPSGVKYKFSAAIGQKGGWLGAAESEVITQLEGRIEQIRASIGPGADFCAEDGSGAESLVGTTFRLHQRLEALQRVQDNSSCEQFLTTVRLLSAEIDVAIAEAKHLESLAAEDPDDEYTGEDEVPQHICWLHKEVTSLSSISSRVEEIDRQLTEQESLRQQLLSFSNDLQGAEAQANHAGNLLHAAAQTAVQMGEASEQTKVQLQKNVATLERKFAEWEANKATAPQDRRRGDW